SLSCTLASKSLYTSYTTVREQRFILVMEAAINARNRSTLNPTLSLNRNTPIIRVYSNQGLSVRQLNFYRDGSSEEAEVRINLQRYDKVARLKSKLDPRLSPAYLSNSSSIIPNHQQINTLSGNVLKTDNVDAGTRVVVSSSDGLPLWQWD